VISLGTIPLQANEDVAVTRNKVFGLSRALQFYAISATRIAFAISEQTRRLLQLGRKPELRITLDQNDSHTDLVLQFHDRERFDLALGLSGFFDSAAPLTDPAGNGYLLSLRVAMPPSVRGLDEELLLRERERLARKTRTQLMDELKLKNEQLEEYNTQLEEMVAARTAELQRAYEKIKSDLETAAEYVRRLIPPPCQTPIAISWKYVPSADLGGDIFGYHSIDSEHLAVYLLDVTGHGVDSALLAVSIVNVIRSASLPGVDFRLPGQVLAALNNAFPMDQFGDKMFTMWYGVFNVRTRRLRWSNGGHPEALLYRHKAIDVERLGSLGPMLGMIQDFEFEESECAFESPGRLFIYSDGAQEIQQSDGAMWSSDDFIHYMFQIADGDDPLQTLLDHVKKMRGRDHLDDDFSAIQVSF
jgi:serine phosphatase RsbU (regulator of sigma subunit)